LPAYLEFEVPVGTEYFTLEVNGTRVHQGLFDRARVPPPEQAAAPAPPPQPAVAPAPPSAPPSKEPPAGKKAVSDLDVSEEEWKDLDLGETGGTLEIDIDFGTPDTDKK
jgi:hypothetical protein